MKTDYKYLARRINNKLFTVFDFRIQKPSSVAIDIVIPVIMKDLKILPLCFEGIKKCVSHPVKNIYIVAPFQEEIIAFCKAHNVCYIDEKTIFGFDAKDLHLEIEEPNGSKYDRSGWLFQQLIKLSGKVGTCDDYLCIDADHVLLQPCTFVSANQKPIFYMSSERCQPYYENIMKLIGKRNLSMLSYVSHKMIFNKTLINKLHQTIFDYTHQDWIFAIVDKYDRTQGAGFSEFELYGNFVRNKVMYPWRDYTTTYDNIADYQTLVKRYGKKYRTITFPEYMN